MADLAERLWAALDDLALANAELVRERERRERLERVLVADAITGLDAAWRALTAAGDDHGCDFCRADAATVDRCRVAVREALEAARADEGVR